MGGLFVALVLGGGLRDERLRTTSGENPGTPLRSRDSNVIFDLVLYQWDWPFFVSIGGMSDRMRWALGFGVNVVSDTP